MLLATVATEQLKNATQINNDAAGKPKMFGHNTWKMRHDARGQRFFAKSHSQSLKATKTDCLKIKKPMTKVAQKQAPASTELEMQRKEKKYRLYIEQNRSRISKGRGSFAARIEILGKVWCTAMIY